MRVYALFAIRNILNAYARECNDTHNFRWQAFLMSCVCACVYGCACLYLEIKKVETERGRSIIIVYIKVYHNKSRFITA